MKALITRLIIGGAIILVGLALLLETLKIANTGEIVSDWWPLIIIIGGVLMLINNTKNYIWAGIVILIGLFIQARTLELTDVNFWSVVWPLAFIGIGISILLNRPSKEDKTIDASKTDNISAILAGSDHINTSEDFKKADLTAVLGGVKLDMRKATIKKSATINLFVLLGGAEIIIPRGVAVKNRIGAALGGVENRAETDVIKGAPELIITGDIIAGGVEIKN